jgi:hypothetical protein
VLGDAHSVERHRQLLQEVGAARYRAAVEATQRAQQRGTVARPGAYFTGVLRRGVGDGPGGGRGPGAMLRERAASLPVEMPLGAGAPAPAVEAPGRGDDLWRVWQAAMTVLRAHLPGADQRRMLGYAVLLELDTVAGWALVGVPNAGLREQVAAQLAGEIGLALGQVTGQPVRVAVAVLAGGGPLGGPPPTLAAVLRREA